MEKLEPMLSAEQGTQILAPRCDKVLLVVARGADDTRRVQVTEGGPAALPVAK